MKARRSGPTLYEKLVSKIAKKWVAGRTIRDAMKSARDANRRGMGSIINYLGEHYENHDVVEASMREYATILDEMNRLHIDGSISPKLTQLGLDIDYDLCLNNAGRLAGHASKLKKFMWIDIESSAYLEDSIGIYLTLLKDHENVGLAFQAYLKEGSFHLLNILEKGGKIRLVKGAYREDASVVFNSKSGVDRSYRQLMRLLFKHGNEFAIATHDQKMIDEAVRLSKKYPGKRFEFQMLKGIRDDIKPLLIEQGFRLAEYIPYGSKVVPYSIRRIKERPRNILLLARSLF